MDKEAMKWFLSQEDKDVIVVLGKLKDYNINAFTYLCSRMMNDDELSEWAVESAKLALPVFENAYPNNIKYRELLEKVDKVVSKDEAIIIRKIEDELHDLTLVAENDLNWKAFYASMSVGLAIIARTARFFEGDLEKRWFANYTWRTSIFSFSGLAIDYALKALANNTEICDIAIEILKKKIKNI
jgi:hypothetical protein